MDTRIFKSCFFISVSECVKLSVEVAPDEVLGDCCNRGFGVGWTDGDCELLISEARRSHEWEIVSIGDCAQQFRVVGADFAIFKF